MGNTFDTHKNGRQSEVGSRMPSKISGLYKSIQNGKNSALTVPRSNNADWRNIRIQPSTTKPGGVGLSPKRKREIVSKS